jgi:nickel-type superoxide dismutase maturation protease
MKESAGAGRTRWRRFAGGLVRVGTALAASAVVSLRRVEVTGDSMAPTLLPGDRLLVRRVGRRHRSRPGDLVTVRSPPGTARPPVLVKRVLHSDGTGVEVRGDNPAASTDSRVFGRLPAHAVTGVVLYRYGPAGRTGVVR